MFSNQTPSLHQLLGARLTVPLIKRDKGPPDVCQQEQLEAQLKTPVLKIIGGWEGKTKATLSPQIHTQISQHNFRSNRNIFKISYRHLEMGTKILGIHQIKMPAES